MAKSWADMSKGEREKYSSKKAYNKQHGLGKHKPKEDNSTSAQTANRAEAAERATNHQKLPEMVKHEASGKMIKNPALLNKYEQEAVDKRKAAQPKNYNDLANRMGMADALQQTGDGQFKEEYGEAMKNMSGEEKRSFNQQRQKATKDYRRDSNYAYNEYNEELQEKAGRSYIDNQSARQAHKNAFNKTGNYVTGPAPSTSQHMIERNNLAKRFQSSGYDYNYAEMLRHRNQGKERKEAPELYEAYGGYQNWFDNHSLYAGRTGINLGAWADQESWDYGNFTGSKDIMDKEVVMQRQQDRQNAITDFHQSDYFKNKYGEYDWFKKNQY